MSNFTDDKSVSESAEEILPEEAEGPNSSKEGRRRRSRRRRTREEEIITDVILPSCSALCHTSRTVYQTEHAHRTDRVIISGSHL